MLQVGVDDRDTLVAPTLNARFAPEFGQSRSSDELVRRMRPFLQGGVGMLPLDRDFGSFDADDNEFLFNMGGGVDFPISERFTVGTSMMFNVIPAGALGEKFFFSWQLATVSFRF